MQGCFSGIQLRWELRASSCEIFLECLLCKWLYLLYYGKNYHVTDYCMFYFARKKHKIYSKNYKKYLRSLLARAILLVSHQICFPQWIIIAGDIFFFGFMSDVITCKGKQSTKKHLCMYWKNPKQQTTKSANKNTPLRKNHKQITR